jgi:hypothetical protein
LEHSSVSECLKGTTVRLPPPEQPKIEREERQKRAAELYEARQPVGPMYDQKSVRLINFGANTLTLMILSYFLGGVALAPLLNWPSCVGFSFSPVMASPCLGSVVGLIIGAFGSLAYTYYYFTHKL